MFWSFCSRHFKFNYIIINYPSNLINHHLRNFIESLRNNQNLKIVLLFARVSIFHAFGSLSNRFLLCAVRLRLLLQNLLFCLRLFEEINLVWNCLFSFVVDHLLMLLMHWILCLLGSLQLTFLQLLLGLFVFLFLRLLTFIFIFLVLYSNLLSLLPFILKFFNFILVESKELLVLRDFLRINFNRAMADLMLPFVFQKYYLNIDQYASILFLSLKQIYHHFEIFKCVQDDSHLL